MISIHALREEGDRLELCHAVSDHNFYPRPPRGGRLVALRCLVAALGISIHALREEGDIPASVSREGHAYFYPRPPRGGRRPRLRCQNQTRAISIHALREEGDLALVVADAGDVPISIHALREEGDVILMYLLTITSVFLSTPSARRATFVPSRLLWEHFEFLSTPSARRATGFGAQTPSGGYDFYPRPPRGGRQDSETNGFRIIKFLSTPSARRATKCPCNDISYRCISIHALREEGDVDKALCHRPQTQFLSTPSARRATSARTRRT